MKLHVHIKRDGTGAPASELGEGFDSLFVLGMNFDRANQSIQVSVGYAATRDKSPSLGEVIAGCCEAIKLIGPIEVLPAELRAEANDLASRLRAVAFTLANRQASFS